MAILDRFLKQDAENGLSYRFSKDYKIVLTRIPLPEGIEVYLIENKSKNERLIIPRELFDRFRSGFLEFSQVIEKNKSSNQELEKTIYFKDQEIYRLRTSVGDATKIIIQDGIRLKGSTGHLTVPSLALAELSKFFYQPQLKHTNDIFERLVKYHKLFQFSFTAGSESINSQLILRRDLLSQIEDYTPRIQAKTGTHQLEDDDGREDLQHIHSNPQGTPSTAKNLQSNFKSKLGRRDSEKNYTVDYDTLFQKTQAAELTRLPKAADDQTKRGSAAHIKSFPLALKASDLKNLTKLPFLCSLTLDEASFLREVFLEDRQVDLFLGFEMLDAIYKSENKLKTFRFPLYYMKVSIEESGRTLLIHPNKKPEIYLNHLALTSLVESFGIEGSNSVNPIDQFFQTLLTQKIEIGGRLSELSVSMQLPVCEDMFQRTRDILLGLEGENGKGGILGNLNLVGIECDLDSVLLYKASHHVSPIARALEHDIDRIQSVADDYPNRFYRSLLGRFLNPELKMSSPSTQDFYPRHFCPGALPHSTQEIFQKLKEHDIVVLEGPPGTGKTFAIMNLLIHCVNTGQKLLVVSDQKSALHALDEKLQEFLVGHRQGNPTAKNQLSLYRQAIKLVDQLPDKSLSLPHWISILSECLALEATRHPQPDLPASKLQDSIKSIDEAMLAIIAELREQLHQKWPKQAKRNKIAARHVQPTTQEDILDFIAFLDFIGAGRSTKQPNHKIFQQNAQLVRTFLSDRQRISSKSKTRLYDILALSDDSLDLDYAEVKNSIKFIEALRKLKPRTQKQMDKILAEHGASELASLSLETWQNSFPSHENFLLRIARKLWSYLQHPCRQFWQNLWIFLDHQQQILQSLKKNPEASRIARQLQSIHEAFHPQNRGPVTLALEACLFTLSSTHDRSPALQSLLIKLQDLQADRDRLIKDLFMTQISHIVEKARLKDSAHPTSSWTRIETLLQGLKDCSSIDQGLGVSLLQDLQEALLQSFPVWMCRKQAVSFLFPSREHLFDLVIIDEAGQCRVDDAIPLLYRAKKILVVGDDKQTVLDKNSNIDDFLFQAFNLEDHLRLTQARGMKGGGSHIFGLVKSIKQAEVMLDEHFRCPPDIIHYSNQYVYSSNLKIMQWKPKDSLPSVVVDDSEKNYRSNAKASRGKYKDIETELIDRFFEFVAASIKKAEKELGRTINLETEVALCYFLLKNEIYIKDKKPEFLRKMGRGADVLDGAGAALQGKERNFIFYLWDINSGNIRSFRQGDDPDKRKGELNVLMSRPKMRAYHYLHADFAALKHDSATITDYLWKVLQAQSSRKSAAVYQPRKKRPGAEFRPWQRSSGQLIRAMLIQILYKAHKDRYLPLLEQAQVSVLVGHPRRKVDLMLLSKRAAIPSIAIVDLASFELESTKAEAISDYYFQLKRAIPAVTPCFLFLHELADENSESFQYLLKEMNKLLDPS